MGIADLPLLDTAALNRATLARQHLLERTDDSPLEVIRHLVGLQSQAPQPPYVGLWTRIHGFDPQDLSALLVDRTVVRMAMMRSTVHLIDTGTARRLRPVLTPMLARSLQAGTKKQLASVDVGELLGAAHALMTEAPQTFAGLAAALQERWPNLDSDAIGHAARTWLPLVQVPPRGLWGQSGPAAHVPFEDWTGPHPEDSDLPSALRDLVRGYLGAFGPATVLDAQKWSGLTRLSAVFAELGDELLTFRSAIGTVLYDLPGAPRPDGNTPARVRYLPEWDNLLLSHADRTRVLTVQHQQRVFTVNGIIRSTILVDGRVAGIWRVEAGELVVDPFEPPEGDTRDALVDEGEQLLTFVTGTVGTVRIVSTG